VEDLNIHGMVKNHHLAKSISDAGWNSFLSMLCYKAEEAVSRVLRVNPCGTSQECSRCGKTVRMHQCPLCGLVLDRDVNAATEKSAEGLKECEKVTGHLHHRAGHRDTRGHEDPR